MCNQVKKPRLKKFWTLNITKCSKGGNEFGTVGGSGGGCKAGKPIGTGVTCGGLRYGFAVQKRSTCGEYKEPVEESRSSAEARGTGVGGSSFMETGLVETGGRMGGVDHTHKTVKHVHGAVAGGVGLVQIESGKGGKKKMQKKHTHKKTLHGAYHRSKKKRGSHGKKKRGSHSAKIKGKKAKHGHGTKKRKLKAEAHPLSFVQSSLPHPFAHASKAVSILQLHQKHKSTSHRQHKAKHGKTKTKRTKIKRGKARHGKLKQKLRQKKTRKQKRKKSRSCLTSHSQPSSFLELSQTKHKKHKQSLTSSLTQKQTRHQSCTSSQFGSALRASSGTTLSLGVGRSSSRAAASTSAGGILIWRGNPKIAKLTASVDNYHANDHLPALATDGFLNTAYMSIHAANPKAYIDFSEDVEIVQVSLACRRAVGWGCDGSKYSNMRCMVGQKDVWEVQFGGRYVPNTGDKWIHFTDPDAANIGNRVTLEFENTEIGIAEL